MTRTKTRPHRCYGLRGGILELWKNEADNKTTGNPGSRGSDKVDDFYEIKTTLSDNLLALNFIS